MPLIRVLSDHRTDGFPKILTTGAAKGAICQLLLAFHFEACIFGKIVLPKNTDTMNHSLLTLTLCLLCSFGLRAQDTPYAPEDDEVVMLAEQMPRFPGCEDLEGDNDAKKRCADQKLVRFIYGQVKYPKTALENNVQGMAMVSFIVTEEGRIADVSILRNPGSGLGEEAKRVVELMNAMPDPWTPGRINGEIVRVRYN